MPERDEVQVYVWYVWDCSACGETQECEPPDVDPTGEEVECRSCGEIYATTGSAS